MVGFHYLRPHRILRVVPIPSCLSWFRIKTGSFLSNIVLLRTEAFRDLTFILAKTGLAAKLQFLGTCIPCLIQCDVDPCQVACYV